jgi:hypothetical protein
MFLRVRPRVPGPAAGTTLSVGLAFAWIGTFLSLTAVGWAVQGGIRLYRAFGTRRPAGPVPGQPIERLGADVCRLRAELEAAENEMRFTRFKAARVTALRGAYLDVLSAMCERLDVRPPAAARNAPVPLTDIYRAEAALRERGLDVRGAAISI